MNFIQNEATLSIASSFLIPRLLKKVNKTALVKKLTVQQLKVEQLKACLIKIQSVYTLIDDENEPISA